MGKKRKKATGNRVRTGNISGSAVAVGSGASASVVPPERISQADAALQELLRLLPQYLPADTSAAIQADVSAVREELGRKRPNFRLVRSSLVGIAASLGAVDSLADIALKVLELLRHAG